MFSEQEKLRYQRAQKVFFETQRRKSELPEKDKRLFEQLGKVKLGRYDVACPIALMIADVYQNNALEAFNTIFTLGFMNGQRAEKARQKRKEMV